MTNFRHPQPLTPKQIDVLERVKPNILAEAETFDMSLVTTHCGTPSCIAGHLSILIDGIDESNGYHSDDMRLLKEVQHWFGVEAMPLFFSHNRGCEWTTELQRRYESAELGSVESAHIAIEAIDLYIQNTRTHFANESEA